MLLLLLNLCYAQDRALNASYVAQAWRPGGKLGIELPLSQQTLPDGARSDERLIALEPAVSGWYHRHNHTPLTAGAQLHVRWLRPDGWTRSLFVGQGATFAINDGLTYEFDDSGELVGRRAGHWMSATALGFGIGSALPGDGPALAWHARPTMTVWAPYNSGWAPVFTVEIGIRRALGED